jgi:hypothetical protein
MNGYADDLAAVIETLDLRDVTLVGQSSATRARPSAASRTLGPR